MDTQALSDLKPAKEFFIGVDSDGCAFDNMTPKHRTCFCPNFIRYWGLEGHEKIAEETWDFVNLFSKSRGCNRFIALVKALELLQERGISVSDFSSIAQWTKTEPCLGNDTLKARITETNDPILKNAMEWSLAINRDAAEKAMGLPPFPLVRESLEKAAEKADVVVISQGAAEAIRKEWIHHRIAPFTRFIAGQEFGGKKEQLTLAAGKKYPPERILMLGDASGDLEAAIQSGALFYPILPGDEVRSWEKFHDEALEKFFSGSFAGPYQKALISDLETALLDSPPWT